MHVVSRQVPYLLRLALNSSKQNTFGRHTDIMEVKVLVYTDNDQGASEDCVSWVLNALTQCMESIKQEGHCTNYAVERTTAPQLLNGDWRQSTNLIVMPGGRDLPYVEALAGRGNKMIREFVSSGGAYLGLCAGGYYGSSEVEFEKNDPIMSVCGTRELGFFPGKARGTILPGFQYENHEGAHPVLIKTSGPIVPSLDVNVYYNGGCEFVPSPHQPGNLYSVIASYQGLDSCVTGHAIVSCSHGSGRVVLTGVHLEVDVATVTDLNLTKLISPIEQTEPSRKVLLEAIIKYLLGM